MYFLISPLLSLFVLVYYTHSSLQQRFYIQQHNLWMACAENNNTVFYFLSQSFSARSFWEMKETVWDILRQWLLFKLLKSYPGWPPFVFPKPGEPQTLEFSRLQPSLLVGRTIKTKSQHFRYLRIIHTYFLGRHNHGMCFNPDLEDSLLMSILVHYRKMVSEWMPSVTRPHSKFRLWFNLEVGILQLD